MIKKLLGSLAIILLFSACGGDGQDGIGVNLWNNEYSPLTEKSTYVMLKDQCTVWPNKLWVVELSCEQLEELDYVNNPPDPLACIELEIYDMNGKSHAGYFESFQKGIDCD